MASSTHHAFIRGSARPGVPAAAALLFTLLALVLLAIQAGRVAAADGDSLRMVIADRTGTDCASIDSDGNHNSVGVGVAFDGTSLLISCYSDNTITAVSPADGSQVAIHTITDASSLGALAWDAGRGVVWACSNFSTSGTIDLSSNAFLPVFETGGCFDGLAYDAADDSLWTSPDATSDVSHYTSSGTLLGTGNPVLGDCGNSGIAVGGSTLYLANNGCSEIYASSKDFSSVSLFASFPARIEDMECDNLTFSGQGRGAIWSIDAYDNILNAWEIPAGSCAFGGGGGTNTPPTVNAGGPYSGTEGSAVSLDGTVSDTDAGDTLTTSWSYAIGVGVDAGATCAFADASAVDTSVTCTDDGQFTLTLTANDGVNPDVTSDATLTLVNADPSVSITSPGDASTQTLGASINLSATVSDAGSNDTHTCAIDWGDGTVEAGTLASGTCSGSHAYAAIGVYTIMVTATDDDGGIGSDEIMVVVADESTKVTGGGFIVNGGRTSFGFVVKNDGDGLHGQLQVRAPGHHRFHGDAVTSLAVSDTAATWWGTGRWDGADGYTFEVSVVDNGQGHKKTTIPDQFSVVIRDGSGAVVFSTSGPLKGGNITVH